MDDREWSEVYEKAEVGARWLADLADGTAKMECEGDRQRLVAAIFLCKAVLKWTEGKAGETVRRIIHDNPQIQGGA
ncbi:MAG: hypothetical protein ABFE13_11560 [Phycisphaerales bacterium]